MRFPKQHIADQVAERILKVEKQLAANSVQAQGVALEQALRQPPGDMLPLPDIEAMIPARALDL